MGRKKRGDKRGGLIEYPLCSESGPFAGISQSNLHFSLGITILILIHSWEGRLMVMSKHLELEVKNIRS